eukprot:Gb_12487 [translate_table: standard]
MFGVLIGVLLGQTCVVYVQGHVGWGAGYGITLARLMISTIVFLLGTPFYRHKVQVGSPLQRMAKFIIGATQNRKLKFPLDPSQLYEVDIKEYAAQGRHRVANTLILRFLDSLNTLHNNLSRGNEAHDGNASHLDGRDDGTSSERAMRIKGYQTHKAKEYATHTPGGEGMTKMVLISFISLT